MKNLVFAFLALFPCFTLAQDLCAKTCLIDSECGIGGRCDKGQCSFEERFCFNERWSVNQRGETSNCDGYACSTETGLCLRQAKSSEDCLSGYVYDGNAACIPSVQCNLADPACQDLFERWKTARSEYEALTPEPKLTPFSCVACTDSSTCGAGKMCWQGRCEIEKPFCSTGNDGEQFVSSPQQTPSTCGAYACEKVSSQCFTNCLKNADCRAGKMCVAGSCL